MRLLGGGRKHIHLLLYHHELAKIERVCLGRSRSVHSLGSLAFAPVQS
jgi:hypothetical protein